MKRGQVGGSVWFWVTLAIAALALFVLAGLQFRFQKKAPDPSTLPVIPIIFLWRNR